MTDRAVLGIDVGGTSVKGALVGLDGHTLARHSLPTGEGAGATAAVRAVVGLLRDRALDLGVTAVSTGVVSPGVISDGVVVYASNLPWRNFPLRDEVAELTGTPTVVGHDARTAGIAEAAIGVADGCANFVQVSIGTGIAATLMVDGRVLEGATHSAGELGHTPVLPDGVRCVCGQVGCADAYASGSGLARRYEALSGRAATASDIAGRLGRDALADAVWAEGVRALALALTTATLVLDPELIVFGGGVSLAGSTLVDPVVASMRGRLAWKRMPRIRLSALGDRASLAGALVLAMKQAGQDDAMRRWRRSSSDWGMPQQV